ncbi:acyl-CoA reductase [Azospirillum sp.]|uniref:acyl-CoA reductase n=1 Tax=Azospirillum sp. TaxID=34012 RepID=UPI003D72C9CD
MSAPPPDAAVLHIAPDPALAWQDALARVRAATPMAPFAEPAVGFVTALSQALLADRAMRRMPEVMALAHALRPAELRRLAGDLAARTGSGRLRHARGLVFHVAPANVDTLFAWSWLLSLLCGNANVVRLSRRGGPAQAALLEAAGRLLAEPGWAALRVRTLVLRYGHDEAVTAALSSACDLRVVWGGDASIAAVRRVPLPAGAQELSFPDRVSAALIGAGAVMAADGDALARATEGLVTDVVWFDQNACSSPRLVLWVGAPAEVESARARFWPLFDRWLADTGWSLDGARTQARLAAAAELAADGRVRRWTMAADGRIVLRGEAADGAIGLAGHPGLGLLLEGWGASLEEACARLPADVQTLACFGLPSDTVATARAGARVDRIVPLGRALAFSTDWDGQDLLERLTRIVQLGIATPT